MNQYKVKRKFLLLIIITLSTISCKTSQNQNQKEKQPAKTTTSHNSKNSLDWAGTYHGMMPCTDCEGIMVELKLNRDSTFSIARQYLGKGDKIFKQKGSFEWNDSGNRITLLIDKEPAQNKQYQVGENQLIKLNSNGKKIENGDAALYSLKKVDFNQKITGKYWKLIELRGKKITVEKNQKREAYFILKNNHKVVGNSGCNSFTGTYELQGLNRIHFSKMASTLMACANIDYENEYMNVFISADNYALKGDTLSLNKARMAPLAKFIAVYFH